MPDILKVTTPLPGSENSNRIRPEGPRQEQQVIQTVTDPERVTQPNAQDVYTEREAGKFLPNYESNYEMFLELLRSQPDAMEEIRTLIFSKMGQMISSGIEAGMAEELATFMEMLPMDEGRLLQFVKEQLSGAVKFKGPFFDILRQAMNTTSSHELRQAIVNLLKSYDSMASTPHILKELLANLDSMVRGMPQSMGEQLNELATQLRELTGQPVETQPADGQQQGEGQATSLNQGQTAGLNQGQALGLNQSIAPGQTGPTLTFIRESIMPFLSRYMTATHDFGPVRDFITMFVLNTARFETGSMENFQQALQELLTFDEIAGRLPGVDAQALAQALVSTTQDSNELATQLAKIISKGMQGGAGLANRSMFENIVRAILVNESVYMPLLHAMIPADVDGTLFYSEVWVDPDAEEGYAEEQYERAIKMLVKFDIKGVGCFELVLLHKGSEVDIHLFSPPHLVPFEKQISSAVAEIAERNELHIANFSQQAAAAPILISEVFPKLYERKNAINVVI